MSVGSKLKLGTKVSVSPRESASKSSSKQKVEKAAKKAARTPREIIQATLRIQEKMNRPQSAPVFASVKQLRYATYKYMYMYCYTYT